MAKGTVNRVILVGNLGKDPEMRYTPNGTAVANLTLATSEGWKDKQTGENQERTEWHRLVMYSRTAEIAGEYLKKGAKIYIEGRLQTRKWQDKTTGQDRYMTEIVVDTMQMLGGGGSGGGSSMNSVPEFNAQTPEKASAEPATADSFDDDIPF